MRFILFFFLIFSVALSSSIGSSGKLDVTYQLKTLRKAIIDLETTFGNDYPNSQKYLEQLTELERSCSRGNNIRIGLDKLRRKALLSNPLLKIDGLICVKRRMPDISGEVRKAKHRKSMFGWGGNVTRALKELGLPSNHECNSSLKKSDYDNQISLLSPIHPDGTLRSIYRAPNSGYVGEIDLHRDSERLLFTQSDSVSWKIFELDVNNSDVRQISRAPDDVDCGDACYMPNGKIVFGSTASMQSVPCWHGKRRVSNLYIMKADGSGMRQVCFDQDHNFHPSMLPNGQVLYHRWDYTGISHIYLRQLMVMNPDGTGQRAIYGSNSWFPNSLYFPRALPNSSSRLAAILSGYHGAHRMGQLVIVDTQKGFYEQDGLVQRISGCGQKIEPKIRDNLVDQDWPKFLHPFPLSEKYFLVSAWLQPDQTWGIYLADVFDNLVLIKKVPGYALLEPIPLRESRTLPIIPDRVDLDKKEAVIYLHDVYAGPGLEGVPRGVVKSIRVFSYNFGYLGMAGPHKIGIGGPWEATRILGSVPLEKDGSAMFYAPANTPLAFQALDREGKAVQLMRSWVTAMPGETVSCIGCHESPAEVAPTRRAYAALKRPQKIKEWYGPARGFDFQREVQPVLDAHCVKCHDGSGEIKPDLRSEDLVSDYMGSFPSSLGLRRMHPEMKKAGGGRIKYTPAYEALLPYVRRVSIEDDVSLLVAGELHADTSPLVQMLKRGHKGVRLDKESWDRLITWIDLNAPCHGTWNDVYPVQDRLCERRQELQAMYGGPPFDPEKIPDLPTPELGQNSVLNQTIKYTCPDSIRYDKKITITTKPEKRKIRVNNKSTIALIKIPAEPAFWMAETEITNEQFRLFDPDHNSGYYNKRQVRHDDKGMTLNSGDQPVVRVSQKRAKAFCQWLSDATGYDVQLPTLEQLAVVETHGNFSSFSAQSLHSDYSSFANVADTAFSYGLQRDGLQISGGVEHLHLEGAKLAEKSINDGAVVTTTVASYEPNAFGLYDITGNAAEWTRDERDSGRAFAAGGSFFDHPDRIHPFDYPAWQRVFNVGFRVVVEEN